MRGKHMFGLIQNFRNKTNKILVDYNKFKSWLYGSLKKLRRDEKEQSDTRSVFVKEIMEQEKSSKNINVDEIK